MQLLFSKSIDLFGSDKTAYFSWGTASILWVLGFMYVSQQGIDSYSSNLSRGTMLFLFNLPEMMQNKVWLSGETIRVMTVRHILLVLYGFVFAQSFFYLPINIVHTLYSSGPIFVMAIDYVLNKITITKTQRWGAFLAFFGVLLTVNGHFIYSALGKNQGSHSQFKHYRPQSELLSVQIAASFILITATMGWAYSIVIVKQAKNATHYHLNFQYGYLMVMSAGCLYHQTAISQPFRLQAFIWSLLYQGLPLAIGQTFFSNALKLTKNHGITTMVGFIGVILGYFVKILRYKQDLNFICLCGSILIMYGVGKVALKI